MGYAIQNLDLDLDLDKSDFREYRCSRSNPKIKVFLNNTEARKVFQNGIRATHSSHPNMAYLVVRDVIGKSVFNGGYCSKNCENRRQNRVYKAILQEMADFCAAG